MNLKDVEDSYIFHTEGVSRQTIRKLIEYLKDLEYRIKVMEKSQ